MVVSEVHTFPTPRSEGFSQRKPRRHCEVLPQALSQTEEESDKTSLSKLFKTFKPSSFSLGKDDYRTELNGGQVQAHSQSHTGLHKQFEQAGAPSFVFFFFSRL